MSDININIKEVKAPSLTSAEYGKNLSECFSVINDNFKTLANRDFVKGDKGDSIYTVKSPLVVKNNGDLYLTKVGKDVVVFILKDSQGTNHLYDDVINKIENAYIAGDDLSKNILNDIIDASDSSHSICSIGDYGAFDNLFNEDLRFELIVDSNGNYIGAANYIVFKDKRFNNETISSGVSEDDSSLYVDAVDLSCIICAETKEDDTCGYVALHDIPSLYYSNKYKRFCWKIGNIETGMIAQGPAGKDGSTINVTRVVYVDLNLSQSLWGGGSNDDVKAAIKAWKTGGSTTVDAVNDLKITAFQDGKSIVSWSDKKGDGDHTDAWNTSGSTGDDKIFEKNYPAIVWVSYVGDSGAEAGTPQNNCFVSTISSVEPNNKDNLYAAVNISKQTLILNNLSNDIVEATFNNMLSEDSPYTLKGLHVPYNTQAWFSHMIWSSNSRNPTDQSTSQVLDDDHPLSHLNIATIEKSSENPNIWSYGPDTVLNLTYPTINMGGYSSYISIKDNAVSTATSSKTSSGTQTTTYSPVLFNKGVAIGENTFTLATVDKTLLKPKHGDIQYSDGPLYIQGNSQALNLGNTRAETTIYGKTVYISGDIQHRDPHQVIGLIGYTLTTGNLVAKKLDIGSPTEKGFTSTIYGTNLNMKCPITLGKASLYYDTSLVDQSTDAVSINNHLQVESSIFTPKLQLSEEGATIEDSGDGRVFMRGGLVVNKSEIQTNINGVDDVYVSTPIGSIMLWFISPDFIDSIVDGNLTPDFVTMNDFPDHWFPCTYYHSTDPATQPIKFYNDKTKNLHSERSGIPGTQKQVYDYLVNKFSFKTYEDIEGNEYVNSPVIIPPNGIYSDNLMPIYIMKYE